MNSELIKKFDNFLQNLRKIVPSHKINEIDDMKNILNNKYKMMLFLMLINEDSKEKNIMEFIKKFEI